MIKLLYAIPLSLALLTGCANPKGPISVTYKAEGTLITSVDTAMNLWRDYVVAGNATQKQVDDVKFAYGKYVDAQTIAKGALEKALADPTKADEVTLANNALSNAEQAVLGLINSYLLKP